MSTPGQLPTSLVNLRDVGAASPLLVRGVLLRSDAPLPDDDHIGYAAPWPPRTVIDLRDPKEAGDEHPLRLEAAVVSLPLLNGAPYGTQSFPPSLGALYLTVLDGKSARQLVSVIEAVATSEGPVLVHCTAGKDRTGVAIAAVLSLLGISREEIVADYVHTAANMQGVMARLPHTLSPIMDPELLATIPADMHAAPAPAIEAFLDAAAGQEGGPLGWFLAQGGREETVDALRRRLLIAGLSPPG